MSNSANILDLPNEILMKIADYLPLPDRKNLSITCKRLEQVIFRPDAKAPTVLWLNEGYPTGSYYENGEKNLLYIHLDVLEQSLRGYRAIGIELPLNVHHESMQLLLERVNMLLKNSPDIKELHLIDTHALNILRLAETLPFLFEKLQKLIVHVDGESFLPQQTGTLEMPNLVYFEWYEANPNIYHAYFQQAAITLNAPKLEDVRLKTSISQYAVNLLSRHVSYSFLVHLKNVESVRNLETILTDKAVEFFRNNQFPKLERLFLEIELFEQVEHWNSIAQNMSGLKQLMMSQTLLHISMDGMLRAVLEQCHLLKVLSIEWMILTELITCSNLWERIEEIHVHHCRALVPAGERVVFELRNLRKLCFSFVELGEGELVLEAPKLRELTFSNYESNLDIASTPELTTLFLCVPQSKVMTYLKEPLPKLRHIFLDTPFCLTEEDVSLYNSILNHAGAAAHTLMLFCRSGRVAEHLFPNLNQAMPSLRSFKLIGLDILTKFTPKTLRFVFRIPHLQELDLVNVEVIGVLKRGITLPDNLLRLRTRSLYMPQHSKFLANNQKEKQKRLGLLEEHTILGSKHISINANELPMFYERLMGNLSCSSSITEAIMHLS